jgi:hypothetical protein
LSLLSVASPSPRCLLLLLSPGTHHPLPSSRC